MDNWTRPFWRSVFCGKEGAGSISRVATFLIVFSAVTWVSYLVIRQQHIPELGGLTVWVTSLTAALYGTNKVTGVVAASTNCAPKKDGE